MEFIQLKSSDLYVSRVSLGTWIFGGRRWGNVDASESVATLKCAVECGINFFDTADAYGEGLSEELLGKAVKKCRENVIIATKVGVVWEEGGFRHLDLSGQHIEEAIEASLRRLQTDYIDLYQLHEPHHETPIEETGAALAKAVESGKIRYVGVSNFESETIDELRNCVPILSTQSEYSLIKRKIEKDIMRYCKITGISLLTYSPLCRGMLSGKFDASSRFPTTDNRSEDEDFQGERFRENLRRVGQLVALSQELQKTPSQLAIRWLLEQPAVDVVICGARTPQQLQENLVGTSWSMPQEVVESISLMFQAE